jgi:hypothetical protein
MYYYPFYLHFINLLSFKHVNNINHDDISKKSVVLWTITRKNYYRGRGTKTFTASYNYYTQNYEFDGKRYLSYNDVVNDALNIKNIIHQPLRP